MYTCPELQPGPSFDCALQSDPTPLPQLDNQQLQPLHPLLHPPCAPPTSMHAMSSASWRDRFGGRRALGGGTGARAPASTLRSCAPAGARLSCPGTGCVFGSSSLGGTAGGCLLVLGSVDLGGGGGGWLAPVPVLVPGTAGAIPTCGSCCSLASSSASRRSGLSCARISSTRSCLRAATFSDSFALCLAFKIWRRGRTGLTCLHLLTAVIGASWDRSTDWPVP